MFFPIPCPPTMRHFYGLCKQHIALCAEINAMMNAVDGMSFLLVKRICGISEDSRSMAPLSGARHSYAYDESRLKTNARGEMRKNIVATQLGSRSIVGVKAVYNSQPMLFAKRYDSLDRAAVGCCVRSNSSPRKLPSAMKRGSPWL